MGLLGRVGSAVTQRVHGGKRTSEGFLIVRGYYLFPDQERAIGWCYLGLLGLPVFLASVWYIAFRYGYPTVGSAIPTAHFASWHAMPDDVRVLTAVCILVWAAAFSAMLRLFFLNLSIKEQPLSDLE